jgi:hypothetical protein
MGRQDVATFVGRCSLEQIYGLLVVLSVLFDRSPNRWQERGAQDVATLALRCRTAIRLNQLLEFGVVVQDFQIRVIYGPSRVGVP